jgi:RNA polymerase sigma factor (sigma-70 family)
MTDTHVPPDLPDRAGADRRPPLGAAAPGAAGYDEQFAALAAVSYRVAFRMTGSREESRDIAQEAMGRAFAGWSKVHEYAPAWVTRVTTNLALDHLRQRRRRPDAVVARSTDPAHDASDRADLVAALRTLPARQRDVVVMRFLADLSEAEVARALGCTAGTVKQHAHRGLTALRSSLHLDLTVRAIDHALEDLA